MLKKFLRILVAISLLPLTVIVSSQPATAASFDPTNLAYTRSSVDGLITVTWTLPADRSTVTGYQVAVDSAGSGKMVVMNISDTSTTSVKICYPFTGNTDLFLASKTSSQTPAYTDNMRPVPSYWLSILDTAFGSLSGASCTANTTAYNYTVNFFPGTGSGSMASITGTGFAVTLPANAFTKGAATFQGWATSSGGPVVHVDQKTISLSGATTLNLYAVWSDDAASSSIAINYDSNGGSGSDPASPITVANNDTFTVPSNPYTRDGYRFTWWSSGSDTFTAGERFPKTGTVTSGPVNVTANWTPNKYTYDSNTATAGTVISDQVYAGTQLTAATNTYTAPTGYEFGGWCSVPITVGESACTGGTKYAAGANIPAPTSAVVTLYAIWQTPAPAGGGGGGSAPAPVYVPKPPTISSISAPEVCAVSSQLTIKGTYLGSATVKVDGLSARVISASSTEMLIALPSAPVGTKTITVTNDDGSATTTVKYSFIDSPLYVDYIYPETYKDRDFKYTFKAQDATKYEISGFLPAGLTLNPLTGEITGAPTQTGNYVFTIIASNLCDSTPLNVYMFVDKPIPNAFTCSVAFNNPRTNTISDIKLANLKTCLSPVPDLSPKYISPVIFLSGGIPAGLSADEALTHPRYLPIISLIQSMNLNAQIYYGAFSGSADSVQLNVYWPDPA
jgi:hypothetical protein